MLTLQPSSSLGRSMFAPQANTFIPPSISLSALSSNEYLPWEVLDFSPISPVPAELRGSASASVCTDQDLSTSSDSRPPSPEQQRHSKKKRRHGADQEEEPIRFLLPRIVKQDVRRSYASIFSHVYNTCDLAFTMQFLEDFCRPDCTYLLRKIPAVGEGDSFQDVRRNVMLHHLNAQLGGTQVCRIRGLEGIGKYWFMHMQESPDYVFSVEQVQFKLKSDQTGSVTFTFAFTCVVLRSTELLQDPPKSMCDLDFDTTEAFMRAFADLPEEQRPLFDPNAVKQRSSEQTLDTAGKQQQPGSNHHNHNHNHDHKKARLVAPDSLVQVPLRMEGSICMHFDADSRIHFLDYHVVGCEQ